jgi:hypothetical protein
MYVPYDWKPVSAINSSIIPSFLRRLFTHRCQSVELLTCHRGVPPRRRIRFAKVKWHLKLETFSCTREILRSYGACSYLSLAHGPNGSLMVKDCTSTKPACSSLSFSSSSLAAGRPEAIIASFIRRPHRARGLSSVKEPSSLRAYAERGSDKFCGGGIA